MIKKAAANWRINQTYRERAESSSRNVNDIPGPGTYDGAIEQLSEIRSGPKIQMAAKLDKNSLLLKSSPGPLEY